MELQKYEVDALVNEISAGKLKKSSKSLTISNVKLQAFLKRPASGQQASVAGLNFEAQDEFADALIQFTDTANEIGAKAQVLRQMANDLRKETEACLQDKASGRPRAGAARQKDNHRPDEPHVAASNTDNSTAQGLNELLKGMEAMNQGDYSHLLPDIRSCSPGHDQQIPGDLADVTIEPSPLDQLMAALEKVLHTRTRDACRHCRDRAELERLTWQAGSCSEAAPDEVHLASILDLLRPPGHRPCAPEWGSQDACMRHNATTSEQQHSNDITLEDIAAAHGLQDLYVTLQDTETWHPHQSLLITPPPSAAEVLEVPDNGTQPQQILFDSIQCADEPMPPAKRYKHGAAPVVPHEDSPEPCPRVAGPRDGGCSMGAQQQGLATGDTDDARVVSLLQVTAVQASENISSMTTGNHQFPCQAGNSTAPEGDAMHGINRWPEEEFEGCDGRLKRSRVANMQGMGSGAGLLHQHEEEAIMGPQPAAAIQHEASVQEGLCRPEATAATPMHDMCDGFEEGVHTETHDVIHDDRGKQTGDSGGDDWSTRVVEEMQQQADGPDSRGLQSDQHCYSLAMHHHERPHVPTTCECTMHDSGAVAAAVQKGGEVQPTGSAAAHRFADAVMILDTDEEEEAGQALQLQSGSPAQPQLGSHVASGCPARVTAARNTPAQQHAGAAALRKPLLLHSKPAHSGPVNRNEHPQLLLKLLPLQGVDLGEDSSADPQVCKSTVESVPTCGRHKDVPDCVSDEQPAQTQHQVHPEASRPFRRPLLLRKPLLVKSTTSTVPAVPLGSRQHNAPHSTEQLQNDVLGLDHASGVLEAQTGPKHGVNPLLEGLKVRPRAEAAATRSHVNSGSAMSSHQPPPHHEAGDQDIPIAKTQLEGSAASEPTTTVVAGDGGGGGTGARKPLLSLASALPTHRHKQKHSGRISTGVPRP